ncbi:MAG: hypothetical protein ACR2OV_00755 [Hyphomicrobiaceae bacterium]
MSKHAVDQALPELESRAKAPHPGFDRKLELIARETKPGQLLHFADADFRAASATEKSDYEQGFSAGAERAEQMVAEAVAAERERAVSAIEAARLAWVEEEGGKLAGALSGSINQIHTEISSAVAEVLEPILSQSLRARAIEELAAVLKSIISSKEVLEVEVKAPSDLIEAVKNAIDAGMTNVSFHSQSGGEVEVRLEASHVRTKFGHWRSLLSGEAE